MKWPSTGPNHIRSIKYAGNTLKLCITSLSLDFFILSVYSTFINKSIRQPEVIWLCHGTAMAMTTWYAHVYGRVKHLRPPAELDLDHRIPTAPSSFLTERNQNTHAAYRSLWLHPASHLWLLAWGLDCTSMSVEADLYNAEYAAVKPSSAVECRC